MYNYPLKNFHGKTIGVVSLENEDVPEALMGGSRLEMSVGWNRDTRKATEFVLVPIPLSFNEVVAVNERKFHEEAQASPITRTRDLPHFGNRARFALAAYHNHMLHEHGAIDRDYGTDVLGWHSKNCPDCTTLPSYLDAIEIGAELNRAR